jgi:hypothetical protein
VSKSDYETWLVERGTRNGEPYVRRHALHVPLLLARGLYERLSDLQLREVTNDLLAERRRRNEEAMKDDG